MMVWNLVLAIIGWILAALYALSLMHKLFAPLQVNREGETPRERAWAVLLAIGGLVFFISKLV